MAGVTRTFRVGGAAVAGQVFEDTQNSGYEAPTDPGVGGQTVYADLNGNGQLDRVQYDAANAPQPVPDANPAGVSIRIPVSGLTRPVGEVRVSFLIDHPSPSDLVVTLTSPGGRTITLLQNRPLAGPRTQPLHLFLVADAGR